MLTCTYHLFFCSALQDEIEHRPKVSSLLSSLANYKMVPEHAEEKRNASASEVNNTVYALNSNLPSFPEHKIQYQVVFVTNSSS